MTLENRCILLDINELVRTGELLVVEDFPATQNYVSSETCVPCPVQPTLVSNGCTLQLHSNKKTDFGYVNTDGSSYWHSNWYHGYMHNHRFLGFFRNYSEQDINEMIKLHEDVILKSKKLPITYNLLICRIQNHTLFDLFGGNIDLFNQTKNRLISEKFEHSFDIDERRVDHSLPKKVSLILSQMRPTSYEIYRA